MSEASETPAMIGSRHAYTGQRKTVPRTKYERTHVKTGSAALTVCANETAPAPSAMTAPAWPSACAAPIGSRVFQLLSGIFGACARPMARLSLSPGV